MNDSNKVMISIWLRVLSIAWDTKNAFEEEGVHQKLRRNIIIGFILDFLYRKQGIKPYLIPLWAHI